LEKLTKKYVPVPTIKMFHESPAQIRCIVGPVGSGKTSGATLECLYYIPQFLFKQYGIKKTRGVIVRNTYSELRDTTCKTVFDWFPGGIHKKQENEYFITYPNGVEVEILFRSCDRAEDLKKFKSLEVTWYWIDESIEVSDEIKKMLKTRIGRYPQMCPVRFGIETTNPPDVNHPLYSMFNWKTRVPGPLPEGKPLPNHDGFWQPERENEANLRPGYYADLSSDYAQSPDWLNIYVKGEPGLIPLGKLVYNNFRKDYHVAKEPLIWSGGTLYRGWDNSGNTPAAVVLQAVTLGQYQVLCEFVNDKMGIVDFSKWVALLCNERFPNAKYVDYADPAGENQYSQRTGGFTSNAQLMREMSKIDTVPADQNLTARVSSVERILREREGMLIDPSCHRLINGFIAGYVYPEIGTTGIYREEPLKNRFSHVHDALQYVMVSLVSNQADQEEEYHPAHDFNRGRVDWNYDEFRQEVQ